MKEYIATYIVQYEDGSIFESSAMLKATSFDDAEKRIVETRSKMYVNVKQFIVDRVKISHTEVNKALGFGEAE